MNPPASGLFTEVSFRRLLASCNDIVSGDNKGRDDLTHWKTSVVFHHYVETLQEQLADLKTSGRVHEEVLQSYSEQVSSLSAQLRRPQLPAYCSFTPPQQQQRQPQGASALPGLKQSGAPSLAQPRVPPPAAPKLPTGAALPPQPPLKPIPLSDAAKSRLDGQSRVHEALTDELVGMAASLKANTLAIEGKLKERGELLDTTEGALDKSLEQTKASAASATKIRSRGRLNLCLTCMILLAIGVSFAGMYVFIRFTSLTGYKANKMAAPVPAAVPLGVEEGSGDYYEFSSGHEEL